MHSFQSFISTLMRPEQGSDGFQLVDAMQQLKAKNQGEVGLTMALNAAFLISLAGGDHPTNHEATELLARAFATPTLEGIARFYQAGLHLIPQEIERVCREDATFAGQLQALHQWVAGKTNPRDQDRTAEKLWSAFFPEAVGLRDDWQGQIDALRARRTVNVLELSRSPISDPIRQILFTSNVLLGMPAEPGAPEKWGVAPALREQLLRVAGEPQLYWYDHPIQIGVEPAANEVLYGLRGLDAALDFERDRGRLPLDARLTCVLTVSTTHRGLQDIAQPYLEGEFARSGRLRNLDVYTFTEEQARRLVDDILAPAARHYMGRDDATELLAMFGVDGEYGRHYSFLKAIAAFWSVFIRPEIAATFKIDLDQVFPQRELVAQTGRSAFEHFTTPLWGAQGVGADGEPLDLGMIAGALVNEKDIGTSLFTPDVRFPDQPLSPDEYIFFSALPQALSTKAEMMARYDGEGLDGRTNCLQRVHVTGGTNGIRIDSLRRHRPFTPSFIGRAEDQAYLLSALPGAGPRLAYLHEAGLIMRHDKEAFAQTAIQSAKVGTLIGDYLRILYFSAYARVLAGDVAEVKRILDPFTGCFISRVPTTVAYLRFALKAASLYESGNQQQAQEFVTLGTRRISGALEFVQGEASPLRHCYERERAGWHLYYDTLSAVEEALARGDSLAAKLKERASALVARSLVRTG